MRESLDELSILKQTEASTLSISQQQRSAAACKGTAFFKVSM